MTVTGAADVPDVDKQTARNPTEKKAQSPTQNVLLSIDRQYF